jgi:hypothetical protein
LIFTLPDETLFSFNTRHCERGNQQESGIDLLRHMFQYLFHVDYACAIYQPAPEEELRWSTHATLVQNPNNHNAVA